MRIYGVIGILVSVEKSWSIGEVVASVGVLVVWLVWDGGVGWWGMLWGCLGKVPKTSQVGECPDFFGRSILPEMGGVEMHFTHNGEDNISSLGLGGGEVCNKLFLSNFVSGGTLF